MARLVTDEEQHTPAALIRADIAFLISIRFALLCLLYSSLAIARLAPDDYHRFHLPLSCTIGESRIYSGGYASVNPLAIRSQKDVLTQNKRVLTLLHNTVVGDVFYIAVGATMVGSVVLTTQPGDRKRAKGDEARLLRVRRLDGAAAVPTGQRALRRRPALQHQQVHGDAHPHGRVHRPHRHHRHSQQRHTAWRPAVQRRWWA